MVQADPLFAAEGVDLERGEVTLDGLEEVAHAYEDVLGKHVLRRLFFYIFPVARTAIPVRFLRSFIESERQRRRFLAYPTMSAAQSLVDSWETAQKHYSSSVARITVLYRTLQVLNRVTRALSPEQDKHGNILTSVDIDRQLRSLKTNAHALARAVSEKRDCLRGTGEASHQSEALPTPVLQYREGSLPEKYARFHALELLHGVPFRHGEIMEEHGPLLYTLSNFDGTPTAHNFKLYFMKDNKHGLQSLRVTILDTYRFLKISAKQEELRLRNHQALADTGIPYWFQPASTLYTTRDQTYYADIATIVDARRRPHLDQKLLQVQKSSLFDLLLGSCLGENLQGLESLKEHVDRGTYTSRLAGQYLLNKSYPSMYFLTFNGSVWRLPKRPDFLGSARVRSKETTFLSADDIVEILTPEEIELVMKSGRVREEVRREKGFGRLAKTDPPRT